MKAVCPGSFDPVTMGHPDIFPRPASNFHEVVVLVTGTPTHHPALFTIDERMDLIREVTADVPNLSVDWWGGLLVDYTSEHGISALVKGLRTALDYGYELPMAQMNRRLSGIDTFFLLTDEKYGYISSSLCKEVAKYGGDVSGLLPDPVVDAVKEKYSH